MTYLDQYTDEMVKSKPKARIPRRARHRVSTKAASCSSAGSRQNSAAEEISQPRSPRRSRNTSFNSGRSSDRSRSRNVSFNSHSLHPTGTHGSIKKVSRHKKTDSMGSMVGIGPFSASSANSSSCILSSKEAHLTYLVLIASLHFILLSMPFLSTSLAWTLTNCLHSCSMYYVLHYCKGSPFAVHDQGKFRKFTYWEQIEDETTKKVFNISPIVLFVLAQFYSLLDHVPWNLAALAVSLVPKMQMFYGYRFWGINQH